ASPLPDTWSSGAEHPHTRLTPNRRVHRENAVKHDAEQKWEEEAQDPAVRDRKGNLPGIAAREPRWMPASCRLHRDFRARVGGAHKQHTAGLQLRQSLVLAGVK